jgi:Prephenate dehydratase
MSNPKEQLSAIRTDIDNIDKELISLLEKRMECSEKVAEIKLAGNIAIMDEGREEQVLARAKSNISEKYVADSQTFMRNLLSLSRLRQAKKILPQQTVSLPKSAEPKENPKVGYQGVKGAWGQAAAKSLFTNKSLQSFDYFEDIFTAINCGNLDYGVLPIENSQSGAIGEVYDLLRRYGLYIVKQTWVDIAQCLLALPGTNLSDLREIYSHPEGFKQCFNFLKGKNLELTPTRNTAVAAQLVKDSGEKSKGAIASRTAAEEYGLEILVPDIMDKQNNKTRFIVVAKAPKYDEQSNIISISFATAHKSGALSAVIECFALAGLSLTRIESRPTGTGIDYRFFVDLDGNVSDPQTLAALQNAAGHCEYFEILGCYGE